MTVVSTAHTITDTAARIDTVTEGSLARGSQVIVANTGGAVVYLGPAGVTTSTGFPLAATTTLAESIELTPTEALYAICATSTTLRTLETGI